MANRVVACHTCLNGIAGGAGQVGINRRSSGLPLHARISNISQSTIPTQLTSRFTNSKRAKCFPLEMMRSFSIYGGGAGLSCKNSSFAGMRFDAAELHSGCESRGGHHGKTAPRKCGGVGVEARGSDSVDASQRILASLGYLLPLLDGIRYGRYLFQRYPVTQLLVEPLVPLIKIYNAFPFAPFIAFFTLYLAIVQNPNFSRFVRFNTMQAIVLDVLLILPSLVERIFAIKGGFAFELLVVFYNTVFVYLFACFLYGVGNCILGKTPRLPLVAEAADNQVR